MDDVNTALRAEFLDAKAIAALDAGQWDRLSAAALCDNPFYSRQYVLAGLDTIDNAAEVQALCVRDGQGELVGLFPFRRRMVLPFVWPVADGAANLYQFSGTPLIARSRAETVIGAWLDAIAAGHGPRFWTLGNFEIDGPLAALIAQGCATRGMVTRSAVPYPRPHLSGLEGGFAAHCSTVIPKGRLKDIQRNLRRLREQGAVTFERATDPALVRERLEQFLAMEQAGWKGAGGTAFLSSAGDADFARLAFGGADGRDGLTAVDSLLLDGKPIAMSLNIAIGSTAFTPKCTYDENWRKQSPGLVLEYLVIERFYATGDFGDMDAATTTGGHLVLDLWNAHKAMGRLIIGPADWRSDALARGWDAAYAGKQRLKRLLKREG